MFSVFAQVADLQGRPLHLALSLSNPRRIPAELDPPIGFAHNSNLSDFYRTVLACSDLSAMARKLNLIGLHNQIGVLQKYAFYESDFSFYESDFFAADSMSSQMPHCLISTHQFNYSNFYIVSVNW